MSWERTVVSVRSLMLFILLMHGAFAVQITEIMYNPLGSDSGHEWIEILSNEPVNISGWKFYEAGTNHKLTIINGSWIVSGYAVIADEYDTFLEDYPSFNGTLFDSSWSSLSNSGEFLGLMNSSLDLVDSVNYSSDWGGGSGYSLELTDSWNTSLIENGTPGSGYAICIPGLVNTTFTSWVNHTECLINDTYTQNRSLIQYDQNNCVGNSTFWDYQSKICDYCVPSWVGINTSCLLNDEIIQWGNDSNSCYTLTNLSSDNNRSNITHSLCCDFDGDGFIGNVSNIISEVNFSMERINKTIILKGGNNSILEFDMDGTINLASVEIDMQDNSSNFGYILVKGFGLTKTLYLDNIASYDSICIDDSEIVNISEISANCNEVNETLVQCDGTNQSGYICEEIENRTRYKVTGLRHSGVIEKFISSPSTPPSSGSSSAGGSGGSGGGGIFVEELDRTENNTPEVIEYIIEEKVVEKVIPISLEDGEEPWWEESSSNSITGSVVGDFSRPNYIGFTVIFLVLAGYLWLFFKK